MYRPEPLTLAQQRALGRMTVDWHNEHRDLANTNAWRDDPTYTRAVADEQRRIPKEPTK